MQNELIFWRKAIKICQMLCNNQELYRSMRDRNNDRETEILRCCEEHEMGNPWHPLLLLQAA
jgi:hypothetical protein